MKNLSLGVVIRQLRDYGVSDPFALPVQEVIEIMKNHGRKWIGERPVTCDHCKRTIEPTHYFVDGRFSGAWGHAHEQCYRAVGGKFGTGLGQMFNPEGFKVLG